VDGDYVVKPATQGMGLCTWFCSLTVTYTVRNDKARRIAWLSFLALLRLRMSASAQANIPAGVNVQAQQNGANPVVNPGAVGNNVAGAAFSGFVNPLGGVLALLPAQTPRVNTSRRAFLIDFNFREGLYNNSKKITFSASWKLITTFTHILLASGLWTKLPEVDDNGNNLWAASMADISGAHSWLRNDFKTTEDVIVDFGNPGRP
jgi:hypothetical protein